MLTLTRTRDAAARLLTLRSEIAEDRGALMKTLHLDDNEATALTSALDAYLNGNGMSDGDEDEATLEALLSRLEGLGA